jgi:hypothetical protein
MSDPITAAAIGAGISGGTSLLRGKSLGSSLKSAAMGGALGGAGGYLGNAIKGAGIFGGATGGTTGGAIPGSIDASGLIFNPSTGGYLNPEYFVGAGSGMPLFTGGGSALSQIGTIGSNLGGSVFDSIQSNPTQALGLGMNVYDRMNQSQSQAPLQGIQDQTFRGQQQPMPTPQFNSLLQLPKKPIYIG